MDLVQPCSEGGACGNPAPMEESRQSPIVGYADKFEESLGRVGKYDSDFEGQFVELRVRGVERRERGVSRLWRRLPRSGMVAWIGGGGTKGGFEMEEWEGVYPKGSRD